MLIAVLIIAVAVGIASRFAFARDYDRKICDDFVLGSVQALNTSLAHGTLLCIKARWQNYTVFHDGVITPAGPVPVLVYVPGQKSSAIVIYVHGGPRKRLVVENDVVASQPINGGRTIVVIDYAGGLNRTAYPMPDFRRAIAEVRSVITSFQGHREGDHLILSGDSAGGAILAAACVSGCASPVVLLAPLFVSAQDAQANIHHMCGSHVVVDTVEKTEDNSGRVRCLDQTEDFRNGNSVSDFVSDKTSGELGRLVKVKERDQFLAFFGDLAPVQPRYDGLTQNCLGIIFDPSDPVIGADALLNFASSSIGHLKLISWKGFGHPDFIASHEAMKRYWRLVSKLESKNEGACL